ncbi:MAG: Guanylyltransferase [Akkermansiaceae bacterium]|nr:Guanylyltransferase [Akkermansiaceae bacterium]
MRFDELDKMLRAYETANDRNIPPGFHIVARLDGRGFTRLTKELMDYEAPYDPRFRDAILATMERLMDCGFKVLFAYAQSDEISLLFHPANELFERKHRKWLSILSGEASAALSIAMGRHAVMDCRIVELPDLKTVGDYFRWRMEDAARNCLNSHCYWMRRKSGDDVAKATAALSGISTPRKHQLLFDAGIHFNELPLWQKRGYGMVWEDYEKEGVNAKTGAVIQATRRRLAPLMELPMGDSYVAMIDTLLGPSA